MFLLNLTLPQLLALFGAASALAVALYLLDRSRRRQVVATLRFWAASENAAEIHRRRRIQQPFSLLLQLASIALLLLAAAQPRVGARDARPRDHVILLDTSAWMGARSAKGALIEEARELARRYLRALPASDRVMLVRADALATPATAFESNRRTVERAIAESEPAATALNLGQAFDFARQTQRLHGGSGGEIVFIGAGRTAGEQSAAPPGDALRVLPVSTAVENCGLRKIGLRRSASDPDVWEALIGVRNYGSQPRVVPLVLLFGGAPVGTRRLTIGPGAEQSAAFQFRTRAAGLVEARLLIRDAFAGDDRAALEIPPRQRVKVAVFTAEPALLRPLLAALPQAEAVFHSPGEYGRVSDGADITILDRFAPPAPPRTDAIWIEPPARGAPVTVRETARNVLLAGWRSDHPLAGGLRVRDVKLESAEIFADAPDQIRIAEVERGPVVVARDGKLKMVALGFHPVRSAMRYQLATPLLFANILRWMAPDIFRRSELNAGSAGTVHVALEPGTDVAAARVVSGNGTPLPHTLQGSTLRFFAGAPGTVRVLTGDREMVYSLTLPEMAVDSWTPPANVRRGIPPAAGAGAASRDLWPWLALAGALGLLTEWLLYGRSRVRVVTA